MGDYYGIFSDQISEILGEVDDNDVSLIIISDNSGYDSVLEEDIVNYDKHYK